jgi:hypothetical protein
MSKQETEDKKIEAKSLVGLEADDGLADGLDVQRTKRFTNPLARKLLEFHHEKIGKFSVRELFRG